MLVVVSSHYKKRWDLKQLFVLICAANKHKSSRSDWTLSFPSIHIWPMIVCVIQFPRLKPLLLILSGYPRIEVQSKELRQEWHCVAERRIILLWGFRNQECRGKWVCKEEYIRTCSCNSLLYAKGNILNLKWLKTGCLPKERTASCPLWRRAAHTQKRNE